MADQNNAEEHDMMTSGMLQRATTPELIALRARKEDARFGVYAEWAGILLSNTFILLTHEGKRTESNPAN